jgi:hypothetical protein
VISLGGTSDHGAQGTSSGSGGDGTGLLHTGGVSAVFAGGLVEPRLDVALPILVEMAIGNHIIPFGRHGDGASNLMALKCQTRCKQRDVECKTAI